MIAIHPLIKQPLASFLFIPQHLQQRSRPFLVILNRILQHSRILELCLRDYLPAVLLIHLLLEIYILLQSFILLQQLRILHRLLHQVAHIHFPQAFELIEFTPGDIHISFKSVQRLLTLTQRLQSNPHFNPPVSSTFDSRARPSSAAHAGYLPP